MADYPNSNIQSGDGVSGRGILIAIFVILAVIIGLALLGSGPTPIDPSAIGVEGEAAAPASTEGAITAPAPTE